MELNKLRDSNENLRLKSVKSTSIDSEYSDKAETRVPLVSSKKTAQIIPKQKVTPTLSRNWEDEDLATQKFITLQINGDKETNRDQDQDEDADKSKIDPNNEELNPKVDSSGGGGLGKRQKGWKKYFGIMLTIAAAIQFSLSALMIKVLNYHPFNLGVWRFFVMILIPIPFLVHAVYWKKQKVFSVFWPMNRTLFYIAAQAIIGSNSLVLLFYALQKLNIADALVISTSAPVFVVLLAYLFLGEKAGFFPIFTALLTLCGVGIISKPPIITGATTYDENLMVGALLSFGSMMCLATTYCVIRYLRTVHHALVNLCFAIWGFLQCCVMAYFAQVIVVPTDIKEIGLLIASAVLSISAQTCITLALKYEQAGPVSLVRTTELLFAFLWQFIFLGVNPDFFSLLGALIVISAVVLTAVRKMISNLPVDHKYRRIFWILLV